MLKEGELSTFGSQGNDAFANHLDIPDDARVRHENHIDKCDLILTGHLIYINFTEVIASVNYHPITWLFHTAADYIVDMVRKLSNL